MRILERSQVTKIVPEVRDFTLCFKIKQDARGNNITKKITPLQGYERFKKLIAKLPVDSVFLYSGSDLLLIDGKFQLSIYPPTAGLQIEDDDLKGKHIQFIFEEESKLSNCYDPYGAVVQGSGWALLGGSVLYAGNAPLNLKPVLATAVHDDAVRRCLELVEKYPEERTKAVEFTRFKVGAVDLVSIKSDAMTMTFAYKPLLFLLSNAPNGWEVYIQSQFLTARAGESVIGLISPWFQDVVGDTTPMKLPKGNGKLSGSLI
jgi:hypothetical protein